MAGGSPAGDPDNPAQWKGKALGINAAGGNLGTAAGQFAAPVVVIIGAGFSAVHPHVYERRTPAPHDPALLLLDSLPSASVASTDDPTTMPSATTVCRCNGVTKKDVIDAHVAGDRELPAVAARTRATTGCGGCTEVVCGLLAWMDDVDPPNDVAPPKHSRNTPGNTKQIASSTTQKEISR